MRLTLASIVVVATVLLQRSMSVGSPPLASSSVDAPKPTSAQPPALDGVAPVRVARQVDVEALAGESGEVVGDAVWRGSAAEDALVRVQDSVGKPVIGAALHPRGEAGFGSGGRPWVIPPSSSPVAVTDTLGDARVPIEPQATTVTLVRAAGLAPQLVTLRGATLAHTPPPTVVVTLAQGARAEGRVFGAPAGALARAVTPGHGLQPSESRSFLVLAGDVQLQVEVGPDGTFSLEDLPTGAPLRFELAHEGRPLVVEPDAIMLAAGETRRLQWRVGAGAVARCVVREADGALAEGIGVSLLSSDEGRPGLAETYWTPAQSKRTDASGTATFDPVQGGAWILALEPLQRRAPSSEAYAPISIQVDLSDETRDDDRAHAHTRPLHPRPDRRSRRRAAARPPVGSRCERRLPDLQLRQVLRAQRRIAAVVDELPRARR